MKSIKIKDIVFGTDFVIISGPCVIEGRDEALYAAEFLKTVMKKKNVAFVFKSSYDKANRSSVRSYRGPGLDKGLRILEEVKKTFDLPILTDVHSPEEARAAAEVVDIIQIPAFLSRQTDLLIAAGQTQAIVNIKKGQFMAPWDIEVAIEKIVTSGNERILLTDRGISFGYNNLISDMRAIPIMKKLGYPVIYDATHSVQLPGAGKVCSSGEREFIFPLSSASIAAGADAIYAEAHPEPGQAKCDGANMIPFDDLERYIDRWVRLYEVAH
jgi:2-dehydro-3-deoxyphosphooctonate aldolase (KDO 8-P synthase)